MSTSSPTQVVALIPARYASTRFPGKPLHMLAGKPMIRRVYEQVAKCRNIDCIAIATDDVRIAECVNTFGATAIMTKADHPSGSDRLAEAVAHYPEAAIVVNVQGDEPFIDPQLVEQLVQCLLDDPLLNMATAACEISDPAQIADANVVKVVRNLQGNALYFSRSPLPFLRNPEHAPKTLRHLGIYAYRSEFLKQFVSWAPSPLELTESLEQLRALENGASIAVIITEHCGLGIDTPEQAQQAEQLLSQTI